MSQVQPYQIWIVCSDYFEVGNPAREYLKTKFKNHIAAGVLQVKLLRREDHIKEWTKSGTYPDLVITNGTYQIKDGEGLEDAAYDVDEVFPPQSGTQIIPFSSLESIVIE